MAAVAWSNEASPPGYFVVDDKGNPTDQRMRWVDEAPDNPEDPAGRFEPADAPEEPRKGRVVALEAHAEGSSEVNHG